jgi:MSHA biogenesis protein MshL
MKPSLLPIIVVVALASACQTAPRREDTARNIDEALQTAPATPATPPPPEVAAALLPPLRVELPREAVEQRFDINVQGARAREFFLGLVAGTPYNMVVHPAVDGEITLTLKGVTVGEVLEAVRAVYGYEYEKTASGFHILPARLASRVYTVNYLNVQRSGHSQTRVSSGQVSETPNGDGGGDSDSNSGGSETQQGPAASLIRTDSASDFWQELTAALKTLVGSEGGRSVLVSPQAGLVVVRAMPGELRDVEAYLSTAQDNLQRQVILEAKIIEVTLSDGFQAGVNWAALGQPADGKTIIGGQTGGGTLIGSGASEIAGNTGTLNPGAFIPVEGTDTSAFGGAFTLALNLNDFNAFIELLQTQGDVQVLSSPRVATLNNQQAVIKVGSDEFFITDVDTDTTTGTSTTSNQDITLTPFFTGIALDVTPQVGSDGMVTLHVHPTVSRVVDQNKKFIVNDQEQELPLALSTVREADSVVRAASGQVVVIGGLMEDIYKDNRAGLPFLSDLPGVGGAFRQQRKNGAKTELVILLRPLVIGDDGEWRREVGDAQSRVERLRQDAPR